MHYKKFWLFHTIQHRRVCPTNRIAFWFARIFWFLVYLDVNISIIKFINSIIILEESIPCQTRYFFTSRIVTLGSVYSSICTGLREFWFCPSRPEPQRRAFRTLTLFLTVMSSVPRACCELMSRLNVDLRAGFPTARPCYACVAGIPGDGER